MPSVVSQSPKRSSGSPDVPPDGEASRKGSPSVIHGSEPPYSVGQPEKGPTTTFLETIRTLPQDASRSDKGWKVQWGEEGALGSLDANIVHWGLHHLLDGDACVHRPQSLTTDYAPPPPQPHRASALLDAPALAEVRVDAVDNDEVIAHALQEELVQVAMAEASKTAGGEPDRRATVLAQHWFRPEVVTHLPSEKLQHLPQSKMLDLFQKDYIHAVTVGVGLMVLQQFGGVNAMCFYASEIFVSVGFSSGNTGMLAMVAVQIPMMALGVLPMDKAGRRPLLMYASFPSFLPSFLLQLSVWDITPPDGVKKAMEMQAAAELKKRAQILESEDREIALRAVRSLWAVAKGTLQLAGTRMR
ncbi:Sugar transporter ERD6-like protein 5 [Hordeum vulgare]|nr:Sugar transporter ERD6-like protein 5 [Hordeum vulgare]